jgi:hypothetical protein
VSTTRPAYFVRLERDVLPALVVPLRQYRAPRSWRFNGGRGAAVISDSLSDALFLAQQMITPRWAR